MTGKPTGNRKNDWGTKLLAVVVALMLWFYVDAEDILPMNLDIPVQYINQPEGYVVENGASTVRVTVRGKQADLSGLRSSDFSAIVDLSQAEIGSGPYPILVNAPELAGRFTYQPMETLLSIDQWTSKTVSVNLRTSGEVAQGYEMTASLVPETVTVEGRGQDLERVISIPTETIDLSGRMGEQSLETALVLPDGVHSNTATVTVLLHIQEQQTQRVYEGPIQLRHVPAGYTVTLERENASVVLSGGTSALSEEALRDVTFYVDCRGISAGEQQLQVQVDCGDALTAGEVTPFAVQATVTAPPEELSGGEEPGTTGEPQPEPPEENDSGEDSQSDGQEGAA